MKKSFIVSARKYRPAKFKDVVGQQHVTSTLKNALKNDQLAQSFLFCGPRGVGKTTCARILAKVLNCQNVAEDFEPCGTCDSCKAFSHSSSFNIHELDAASNNTVDDMRALIEQVRFAPQSGKYKIYIIDEVHMLSQSAFNAFLKTLEEPPSYAVFILATTEKHKIIPTILSRCQIFDFKRISTEDMVEKLQHVAKNEDVNAVNDALHLMAQKSEGAMRDALSLFDRMVAFTGGQLTYDSVVQNLNILDYDYFFRITDALLTSDIRDVLNIFDEILRKGFEGNDFINGLSEHMRNLLVAKDDHTRTLLEVSENLKERYILQAELCSPALLLTALNITNQCDVQYQMAKNKRLHVELSLIKLCYIQAETDPSERKSVSRQQISRPQAPSASAREVEQQPSQKKENNNAPAGHSAADKIKPNIESKAAVEEKPSIAGQETEKNVNENAAVEDNPGLTEEGSVTTNNESIAPERKNSSVQAESETVENQPDNAKDVSSGSSQSEPELISPEEKEETKPSGAVVTQGRDATEGPDSNVPEQAIEKETSPSVSYGKKNKEKKDNAIPGSLEDIREQIRSNRKEQEEKVKENNEDKTADEISGGGLSGADPEKVKNAWKSFGNQLKENNKMSIQALIMAVEPQVSESGGIFVAVDNNVQKRLISEVAGELVEHLKKEMNAEGSIPLEIVVNKNPAKKDKRPYTSKEKYDKMVEKNPKLKEMKNRLNLKFDFN